MPHNKSSSREAAQAKAGMSEMDIYHRTRDVFLHYKLPYNAPPPEE